MDRGTTWAKIWKSAAYVVFSSWGPDAVGAERYRFRHQNGRGLKAQVGQPEDAGLFPSFDSAIPMLPLQIPQPQEGTMVAQGCPVIVIGNSESVGPGWAEVLSEEVFSADRKAS